MPPKIFPPPFICSQTTEFINPRRWSDELGDSTAATLAPQPVIPTRPPATYMPDTAPLERLVEVLGLPKELLGFIAYLVQHPKDKDVLAEFADWLTDQNRPEADKIRKLAGQ